MELKLEQEKVKGFVENIANELKVNTSLIGDAFKALLVSIVQRELPEGEIVKEIKHMSNEKCFIVSADKEGNLNFYKVNSESGMVAVGSDKYEMEMKNNEVVFGFENKFGVIDHERKCNSRL